MQFLVVTPLAPETLSRIELQRSVCPSSPADAAPARVGAAPLVGEVGEVGRASIFRTNVLAVRRRATRDEERGREALGAGASGSERRRVEVEQKLACRAPRYSGKSPHWIIAMLLLRQAAPSPSQPAPLPPSPCALLPLDPGMVVPKGTASASTGLPSDVDERCSRGGCPARKDRRKGRVSSANGC